jgi:periplasmic divalent cation tolerance protein
MQSSFTPLLVLCSFPDENKARQIGTLLLEKQLAACVSFAMGQSIYRWQGKIECATEVHAQIKTSQAHYAALEALIRMHHPYEVPEIIALPIAEGHAPYLDWMRESLLPSQPSMPTEQAD